MFYNIRSHWFDNTRKRLIPITRILYKRYFITAQPKSRELRWLADVAPLNRGLAHNNKRYSENFVLVRDFAVKFERNFIFSILNPVWKALTRRMIECFVFFLISRVKYVFSRCLESDKMENCPSYRNFLGWWIPILARRIRMLEVTRWERRKFLYDGKFSK